MLTFHYLLAASLFFLVGNVLVSGDRVHSDSVVKGIKASKKGYDFVPIHVLIYESQTTKANEFSPAERLLDQINNGLHGFRGRIFGQNESFVGFGTKFITVLPILHEMLITNPDSLVVITDSRDVLINNRHDTMENGAASFSIAVKFREAFNELTTNHTGAIVVSAEAQCCVSALTHASPGGYFNRIDGSRKAKACLSGNETCLWAGDDRAAPWENFMKELMIDRLTTSSNASKDTLEYDDKYLNAGLIVGKVVDLIRTIESAQIDATEDDQAVLTDYMYHHPTSVLLDYAQTLFGNNRLGNRKQKNANGCIFRYGSNSTDKGSLVHSITNTIPLFIHSPGGYYECHDKLSGMLGLSSVSKAARQRFLRRDPVRRKGTECNYGKCAEDEGGSGILSGLADFWNELRDRNNEDETTEDTVSSPPPVVLITNDTEVSSPPPVVLITNVTEVVEDESDSSGSILLDMILDLRKQNEETEPPKPEESSESLSSFIDLLGRD